MIHLFTICLKTRPQSNKLCAKLCLPLRSLKTFQIFSHKTLYKTKVIKYNSLNHFSKLNQ